ncbi:MAG: hypothetical protein ABJL67_12635 [Sulfitobacter sp.]
MRSYLTDFNDFSRLGYVAERQHEVDGWNAAQAGMDTGRNANHMAQADVDTPTNPKRKNSDKPNDLVDFILTQAAYDALFSDTMTKIHEAETAVDHVLDLVTIRLTQDEAILDEMIDRLPVLDDGTKVAKSEKDGLVYTLDGVTVDPDVAALVPFTGHEASLETILQQEKAITEFRAIQDQAIADQHRLGEIREEMADKPSGDRLEELRAEVVTIQENSEQIAQREFAQDTATPERTVVFDAASVPSL